MKKVLASLLSWLVVSAAAYTPALAQVKDRNFKDWSVYTVTLQGKKTCYAVSFPKSKTGNYTKRDEPYFIVTKVGDDRYEVSTSSGYPYKSGSDVKLDVDKNKYNMFTKDEIAWAQNEEHDGKIVKSMKKGSKMKVRGTSRKGTYSVDTYSLRGITAAVDRMRSLCG